jgi:toxin YoeB
MIPGISWAANAWDDYLYWQRIDAKKLKRINTLIKDIARHPFDGLGDPEPLRHNWSGYWSRRIDRQHRLVYKVTEETIHIVQCRYHY